MLFWVIRVIYFSASLPVAYLCLFYYLLVAGCEVKGNYSGVKKSHNTMQLFIENSIGEGRCWNLLCFYEGEPVNLWLLLLLDIMLGQSVCNFPPTQRCGVAAEGSWNSLVLRMGPPISGLVIILMAMLWVENILSQKSEIPSVPADTPLYITSVIL